jgi:ribosome-binding factor A
MLSVTRVDLSADLAFADVYVSVFNTAAITGGEKPKRPAAIEGLQSAAGFIQSELARALQTRVTPRLRFHRDTGLREGFDLIQKIDSLSTTSA